MTHAPRWTAKVVVLSLTFILLAGAGHNWAADVADGDYAKVLDHQLKVLQDALKALKDAKEKPEVMKMTDKVRCTAVLIAALAQDNLTGKDAAQRATLRDAALKLAGLLKNEPAKVVDDAIKLAEGLKGLKPDPKAQLAQVRLFDAHIDLAETMSFFKLPKAGGQGAEVQLLKLGTDKKKMIPAAALSDSLLVAAYQTALVADLSVAYVPKEVKVMDVKTKEVKETDVKDWQTYTLDMKKSALELAEKVKANDGKAAFLALQKLNTSCTVCHDKFR